MRWICLFLPLGLWGQSSDAAFRASIEQQRAAIRRQAQSVGARLIPFAPAPPLLASADCDPVDNDVVGPMIDAAAKAHEVKPELLRAVIAQESGFRPCAISSKGAMGLMQLMPATVEEFGVKDPFDAKQSIEGGARFLKQLIGKYPGKLDRALAAYNAGPAAVDAAGGIPDIAETRDYVQAILNKLDPATRTDPPNTPKPKPTGN